MTAPLRRWHFWIWIALCATLAILFIAGTAARRPGPAPNPSVHWDQYR